MSSVSLTMLAWLAGTVGLVWVAPRFWQPVIIGMVSAVFLFCTSPVSLALLGSATFFCYYLMRWRRHDLTGVVAVIVLVLAALLHFKWGRRLDPTESSSVLIPLGLSYYALRLLHYVLERWKGTLPEHSLWTLAGYLFFLPTLTAGPINLFPEYCRGLRRRRWDRVFFSRGCERVLYGSAKIVLLGNYFVSHLFSNWVDGLASPRWAAYLDCIRYGANLYFQFSGYSDIAIGFALLLGFEVAENFNYPFLSRNINDFWKRWHMTLSSWCREYVYMPVAAASRSPRLGIFTAMLLLGLWHELSFRYLAWGAYHGLGIACWQLFRMVKGRALWPVHETAARLWTLAAWFTTFNFVILGFAFTKEAEIVAACRVLRLILFGG